MMKPLYTEVFTLKISSKQKRTLEKLKSRNIKVSDFVRKAITQNYRTSLKKNIVIFNLKTSHYA